MTRSILQKLKQKPPAPQIEPFDPLAGTGIPEEGEEEQEELDLLEPSPAGGQIRKLGRRGRVRPPYDAGV